MQSTAQLHAQFGIENHLTFEIHSGGMVVAHLNSGKAKASVFLYGAHIASFCPGGEEEVLWMSNHTSYTEGKPIRGGIPLCFPWFGAPSTETNFPKHGFARLMHWGVSQTALLADGKVQITLFLESSDETWYFWPHEFKAELTISLGSDLHSALKVINTGTLPLRYSAALHTYFKVGNLNAIAIEGLSGTLFYTQGSTEQHFQTEPFLSIDRPLDRCYINHCQATLIHDASMNRTLVADKQGSEVTVVWNPGEATSRLIDDIHPNGYLEFVCVEAANTYDDTIDLDPGEWHLTAVRISVAQ